MSEAICWRSAAASVSPFDIGFSMAIGKITVAAPGTTTTTSPRTPNGHRLLCSHTASTAAGGLASFTCLTFMADMEHGGKRLDGRDR